MRSRRSSSPVPARKIGVLVVSLLAVCFVAPGAASAGAVRNVQIMDRCDPASFNAMFGMVVCTSRNSGVNVNTFLARLNPKDGGHSAWRFSPGQLSLKPGTTLQLNNLGGETHTFTEVANFGATPIPAFALLNNALPPGTPQAVPIGDLRFIAAGEQIEMTALSPGAHLFECLIHPWMRATVEQG
jgi:plastocyanin